MMVDKPKWLFKYEACSLTISGSKSASKLLTPVDLDEVVRASSEKVQPLRTIA